MRRNDLTVACVYKTGGDYDLEYVQRLYSGVIRHLPLPYRFICLSDANTAVRLLHDWPGWWSKMELFRPDLDGDILYFDLDTMIVGGLSAIASVDTLTAVSDFNRPGRFNSSVMYLPHHCRGAVWEDWMTDPAAHMERCGSKGDQEYLEGVLRSVSWWQDSCPGQIVSYKVDRVSEGVPANARVICFHGKPKPRDIGWKLQ